MKDSTSDRILKHMAEPQYRPRKARALAHELGVDEEDYSEFRATVKTLMRNGRIVLGRGNSLMLPQQTGTMVGIYRGHQRGFGFVVPESPDERGDLYIPPGESADAVTGDTVRARVVRKGQRAGRMLHEGRVVEVLARGNSRFVGALEQDHGRWLVRPDGNTLTVPIEVPDASAKNAHAGDQVVVEITEYPRGPEPARGVIVKRLGVAGDAEVAIRSLIYQYHLPEEFPEEVVAEARRVVGAYDPEREAQGREDLRGEVVFTIDPDDAKDYDDAISLRRAARGQWELGVHIADVAAFVKPGGALDREARERGNSVYFPGHVVPMLPEVLSNGLCSLQEAQPRLVKSAFIRYDAQGRPVATRFANAIIHSAKRLTYNDATNIIEGRTGGYPREVVETLRAMEQLARTIRERRLRDGMLVLDLPEVELVLDDRGCVSGVRPADTAFSHTLIEMFMVEANEAVARLFARVGVPCLRRIHPEPDAEATQRLAQYVRLMGHPLPTKWSRGDVQALLDATRGRPEGFPVHLAVLRSMEQAVYSPEATGHYALASEAYVHFTSPIRRYPDLTIHRLFDAYVTGRLKDKAARRSVPGEAELRETGARCSFTERRAADAEREARKVLVLHLLAKHQGEVFDGVVTGVSNVGVFVQVSPYLVDGLIRFADMPDDWWQVDDRHGAVIGQRSGVRIRIGDAMKVAIAAVDIPRRELDLSLVEAQASTRPRREASADKSAKDAGTGRTGRGRGRSGTPGSRGSRRAQSSQGGGNAGGTRRRRSSQGGGNAGGSRPSGNSGAAGSRPGNRGGASGTSRRGKRGRRWRGPGRRRGR